MTLVRAQNLDFETGDLTGWTLLDGSEGVEITGVRKNHGSFSCKISDPGVTYPGVRWAVSQGPLPCTPGQVLWADAFYASSAWGLFNNPLIRFAMRIRIVSRSGSLLDSTWSTFTQSTGFLHGQLPLEVPITAGAGAWAYIDLGIQIQADRAATDCVYVDDVGFAPEGARFSLNGEEDEALSSGDYNPGFETGDFAPWQINTGLDGVPVIVGTEVVSPHAGDYCMLGTGETQEINQFDAVAYPPHLGTYVYFQAWVNIPESVAANDLTLGIGAKTVGGLWGGSGAGQVGGATTGWTRRRSALPLFLEPGSVVCLSPWIRVRLTDTSEEIYIDDVEFHAGDGWWDPLPEWFLGEYDDLPRPLDDQPNIRLDARRRSLLVRSDGTLLKTQSARTRWRWSDPVFDVSNAERAGLLAAYEAATDAREGVSFLSWDPTDVEVHTVVAHDWWEEPYTEDGGVRHRCGFTLEEIG